MTEAILVHRARRRVRLRVPSAVDNRSFFASIGARLRDVAAVMQYNAYPGTGSMRLLLAEDWSVSVQRAIEEACGIVIESDARALQRDPALRAYANPWRASRALGGGSLLAMAIAQGRRGKLLPAGLTMIFQGWDLLQGLHHPPAEE